MHKRCAIFFFLATILSAKAQLQKEAPYAHATSTVSLEAATIKPAKSEKPGKRFVIEGRRMTIENASVVDLLIYCDGVHEKQIVGAPTWARVQKFDVVLQSADESLHIEQWKMLVQSLLRDRFGLLVHTEKREMNAYVLRNEVPTHLLLKRPADPQASRALYFRDHGDLVGKNATLTDFCQFLQDLVLPLPVVDQTGLSGSWDFELKWTPDETQFFSLGLPPKSVDSTGTEDVSITSAVSEQLGLLLKAARTQVPVKIVDRLESPSEN